MTDQPAQKRILHVFSTLSLGGPQRRFLDYLDRTSENHHHTVYAMDGDYAALELTDKAVEFPQDMQLVKKGNTFKASLQCRKLLKRFSPDLLVTYNWGATEWALANRFLPICPMIHIQDGFTEDEVYAERRKRVFLRQVAYRSCKYVIVPSRALEKLVNWSWKLPTGLLRYIPNGIDIARFQKPATAELVSGFSIDTRRPIVGTVAGLRPEKNVGRLIEAFSSVEDHIEGVQLVIIGDGIGTAALKMLASQVCKPGSVIFTGNLSQPEHILPMFDVFSLSSDTEQMPLSVIEAMAAGIPVVSTDVGDIEQMVSEENKPYIADCKASTLAAGITELLALPEKAKSIGAANRTKAEDSYSIRVMVETYDQLFTEACL